MSIDETIIAQKLTTLIYFYTEETGNIKIYLTEKIVDLAMTKKKRDLIENSYYIRVRVNEARDVISVIKFQNILSKLFVSYNKKYQDIIDFYSTFMPLNEIEIPKKNILVSKPSKKNLSLGDIAPELYLTKYTKFCGQAPTVVDDDYEELDPEKILIFPKNETEGSKPRKYICNYKKHPYPGLRLNILDNADQFKYLPCCLETSQIDKPYYRNYYYGDALPDIVTEQHIISTDKFLNDKQNGYLPQNIKSFFDIIEPNKDYEFYRQGVLKTKSTFLNCILYALNSDINYTEENIIKNRNKLATVELASVCRQEMYDSSVDEIIQKIKNKEEYFDPSLFIRMLEVKYRCNIYIFKRDTENPDGTMIIPRHIKSYFKTESIFEKCIFVYEHMGIDSDNSKYPQCEVIFRWNKFGKKDDLEYNFGYNSILVQNAINVFGDFNKFYILNKQITYIRFVQIVDPISQVIDSYGKTRVINCNFNGNKISIFTSPLPPIKVVEDPILIIYKVSLDIATKFADSVEMYDRIVTSQIMTGMVGDITVSIQLTKSEMVNSNKYTSHINYYNKYKRLSRYILQYLYWIYSKYMLDNPEKTIDNFKNDYITINPTFEYGDIRETFINNNKSLMNGNKLVLKSEETVKRLLYLLKIESVRNSPKLSSFHKRTFIENYYMDVTDFNTYPSQIILKGQSAIEDLIKTNLQNVLQYKLHDIILKKTLSPYFFRNPNIDNNIYLAQNTTSTKKAIEIYLIWKNYKYNPSFNPKDAVINYRFILYSYTNKNTIKSYFIKGEPYVDQIKIIGYKIFRETVDDDEDTEPDTVGKIFYTVLLPL